MRPVRHLFSDWDLFWIERGELTWTLLDGRTLVAGPDEFVLLPPFTSAMVSQSCAPAVFQYLHFDFRMPPVQIMPALKPDFIGPAKSCLVPLLFSRTQAPEVWRAYRTLIGVSPDHRRPWRIERATIAIAAGLAAFAQRRATRGERGSALAPSAAHDHRIDAIARRIDADPMHPWRVDSLARSVRLSSSRLHHLFRRTYSVALKRYIVQARLHLALTKLKEMGDGGRMLSINDISRSCGYSSQHYFCRQFQAHFRISPSAYRRGVEPAGF
jgi:AraC-like DNA-binding protein